MDPNDLTMATANTVLLHNLKSSFTLAAFIETVTVIIEIIYGHTKVQSSSPNSEIMRKLLVLCL